MTIPDGITPKSGWRVWMFVNGVLRSLNGTPWEVLKPLHAACGLSQQVSQISLAMLRQSMDATQGGIREGTPSVSFYPQAAPRKSLTQAYYEYRYQFTRSKHIPWSYITPTIPVYDEDTGERFVPFGLKSRLVMTRETPAPAPPPNEVPAESCSCGVYAANDRKTAEGYLGDMTDPLNRTNMNTVLGRVALWGKIIVYDRGFRAEWAYPQSFFTDVAMPGLEAYGAPILPMKEVDRPVPQPEKKG